MKQALCDKENWIFGLKMRTGFANGIVLWTFFIN